MKRKSTTMMSRRRRAKSADPTVGENFEDLEKRMVDVSSLPPEVKIAIYGKAGTGKTTLAGTFPKALLLDISERGSDSVRDVKGLKVIRVPDWETLELTYWYLRKNPQAFQTAIVDTVSYAQELAIKHVLEKKGKVVEDGKVGGWGTMTKKDWGEAASLLKPFITNMRDLDLNVVFIAHDKVFNAGDEEDSEEMIEPSVGPRLMPSVASVLNASVSLIGNTFIREKYITKGEGKAKKEIRRVQYCLRVGPHSYYITKVRKPKSRKLEEVLVDPTYEDLVELITGE